MIGLDLMITLTRFLARKTGAIKMAKVTQKQRVLKHLQDFKSINPMAALRDYGVYRLAAVIWDLKKDGHVIHSDMVNSKNRYGDSTQYAIYNYKGKPDQAAANDYLKAKNGG
jgi:hypothetical protein